MSTENIPGGKGGRCVRLTTHNFHVPNVMKSGGLNLLEPSGPHRACYGTALLLPMLKSHCPAQILVFISEWFEHQNVCLANIYCQMYRPFVLVFGRWKTCTAGGLSCCVREVSKERCFSRFIRQSDIWRCNKDTGWRRSGRPFMWEMKKCYLESRSRGISYMK